jgi:hypothetical protein
MEILAGLIELDNRDLLPLPWYNRPALGLVSGTHVSVAPVTSAPVSKDCPPDIIVTPLTIGNLKCTSSIVIDLSEDLGSIKRVLERVGNKFNIALMETVTIDQRSKHRITLVLEPPRGVSATSYNNSLTKLLKKLKDELGATTPFQPSRMSDEDIQPYRLANNGIDFGQPQPSKVYDGHVEIDEVRKWIDERYGHLKDRFDFNRVVISSNTEARFIRYIFPRQGAFEVHVPHQDVPTAMQNLTSSLTRLRYNILLSRISKSESPDPRKHQSSVTVAICEPVESDTGEAPIISYNAAEIAKKIRAALPTGQDALEYMFQVPTDLISFGRKANQIKSTRTSRLRERIIAVPPKIQTHLAAYIKERRRVVFFSYPGLGLEDGNKTSAILKRVFDRIDRENHVVAYDGFTRPWEMDQGPDDVFARMWRADAGIFLAPAIPGKPQWLTPEQQIEWGFMAPLCPRTYIVCHKKAPKDRQFMIPDVARLMYEDLSDGHLHTIEEKIVQRILSWFPKPTDDG